MKIKRFNENIDYNEDWEEDAEFDFENEMTVREFLGDEIENSSNTSRYISRYQIMTESNVSSNGIFTNIRNEYLERMLDNRVKFKIKQDGIYEVFISYPIMYREWVNKTMQWGYVYVKNNKPLIFSTIPGSVVRWDNYGAVVFNNTFIVSGHDGSCLYNINKPIEMFAHLY
jgi:hypothetical protein